MESREESLNMEPPEEIRAMIRAIEDSMGDMSSLSPDKLRELISASDELIRKYMSNQDPAASMGLKLLEENKEDLEEMLVGYETGDRQENLPDAA